SRSSTECRLRGGHGPTRRPLPVLLRWRGQIRRRCGSAGHHSLALKTIEQVRDLSHLSVRCVLILLMAPNRPAQMSSIKWLLVFLLAGCTWLPAQTTASSTPAPASQAQKTPAADSDFAASRKLSQQGKYDEAIALLQPMAGLTPRPAGLSHELGTVYYKKGDYLKAADHLKQAVAEDPNDKEAVQLLGLSYYLAGRPAEAIPYLEKVQAWYPRAKVDAAYILSISYIQAKDYPQARKAFAAMFDVPADSGASYLITARMLFRQEFIPVAEDYAQKAIAADPKLPLAHELLGEIPLFMSKIPEAITDFQQELALNPAYAQALYKLADAYSRVQKYDEAERLLQRSR